MKTVIKVILLAAVSAALAILAEQLVATFVNIFWQQEIVLESYARFTWFLALAAVIEEISKYWAIVFVIRKNFGLEKMHFILASLVLGAVWGIFEIGLVFFADQNVLRTLQSGNLRLIFSFASIAMLHPLTAFLIGISVSTGFFSSRLKFIKILLFPVLIHLLFNFLTIQKEASANYMILAILIAPLLAGILFLTFKSEKLA